MKWPSQHLLDFTKGYTPYEELPPSIQSWSRFYLYTEAEGILRLPKDERRKEIEGYPARVRPLIEQEIMRQWSERDG